MAALETLADLALWLRDRLDLPTRQRQELLSALGTLARAAGQPLAALPAAPAPLRSLLNGLTPAMAGVSDGRWRNLRSLLRRALALARERGVLAGPASPRRIPRAAAWAALLERLGDFRARHRLSRLAGHGSRLGLLPAQVDDGLLQGFLEMLQADPVVKDPYRIHREAIREWNRQAGLCADWPAGALTPPADRSNSFALPATALPATLLADIARWRDRLAGTDLLSEGDFRPLRPTSLHTRERQLRTLIAAMVRGGVDPAVLRDLASVVVPEHAACGLGLLMQRAGGEKTVHTGQIAGLVCAIARHFVRVPPAQLARLVSLRRKVTPPAEGMTARNRTRLRPFDDPARLRAFLNLPRQILEEVRRAGPPTLALARRLRGAVAMEVLIMAPVRLRNLRALQLGRSLLRGADGGLTLSLEPHETKNSRVFEAALPAETSRLITLFLDRYQPLLCRRPSDWLFPDAAGDGTMGEDGLRQGLMDLVRDRCGLVVNPHLYRHIAAKLILDQQPGAYGQAQLTLNHKTVVSTTRFYAGAETKTALRHYDALVQTVRGAAAPQPGRRGGRPGR